MSNTLIRKILEGTNTIPRLPASAIKLSQVLSDPGSSMQDIANVIQYDQNITKELLRLCNSAYFGFADTVVTVKDAILKLGTTKVFQLAVSSTSRSLLNRPVDGYALPRGALWRQSIGAALAAQRLGRELRSPLAGMAFTTALLADAGKILLNEHLSQELRLILKKIDEERITFNQAERDVFGIDHAELGAELAQRWQLPEEMVNAIRFHHEPENAPDPNDNLLMLVHLGDLMAMNIGFGLGIDGLQYESSVDAEQQLGISLDRFETLCAEVMSDFIDVKLLFGN